MASPTDQTLLTQSIPAIAGIDDPTKTRVLLYQGGRPVNAPLDNVGLLTTANAATTYQPLDATLTSLAAYSTDGLLTQTAANTFTGRTLTGTANKVTVTNGSGVSGNPTLTIPDTVTLVTPTVTGLLTASGGQIAFPGSQNASSDANTLDDYEEGAWTPGINFGGNAVGMTFATREGRYTKIGNKVTAWGWIALSAKGTSTGVAGLAGFPFTSSPTGPAFYAGAIPYWGTMGTAIVHFGIALSRNATSANLYVAAAAAVSANASNDTSYSNTTQFMFSVAYEAA